MEDKKCASLLAICPMSFYTSETMPGVRSIAMISINTIILTPYKNLELGPSAPHFLTFVLINHPRKKIIKSK